MSTPTPTLTERVQAIRDAALALRPQVRPDGDDEFGRLQTAIDQAEAAAVAADQPPQS